MESSWEIILHRESLSHPQRQACPPQYSSQNSNASTPAVDIVLPSPYTLDQPELFNNLGLALNKERRVAGVGERIRKRRLELDWTQDQLCQKAGISKGFLSDLENGKRSVSAENLLDIARALSLSLDYLMTGKASKQEPTEVSLPASLAKFAAEEGISLRQTLMLLDMQKQIVAHRSAKKKDGLEAVDWRRFYEGVKEFLENE